MITRDPALLAAAAALRREVFTIGQGVPLALEVDGADGHAVHAVVVCRGEVVATGRLLEQGGVARLGRIATRVDLRGRGLGAQVVTDLVGAAARLGLPLLRLHSQADVVGFYQRLGWTVTGPPDHEAGLAHQWMERDLLPGLRPVTDADAEAVQALIGGCFAEYPGCVLDLDDLDAWTRAPGTQRPTLIVLPDTAGGLAACVGHGPGGPGGPDGADGADGADAVELKSLYVAAAHRRRGVGVALVGLVERAARERGAKRVQLWSDTRFAAAHRLYERLGYIQQPATRKLHDPSDSTEFGYVRVLVGP